MIKFVSNMMTQCYRIMLDLVKHKRLCLLLAGTSLGLGSRCVCVSGVCMLKIVIIDTETHGDAILNFILILILAHGGSETKGKAKSKQMMEIFAFYTRYSYMVVVCLCLYIENISSVLNLCTFKYTKYHVIYMSF